jgi:prepilin-type processing-associated H-X9-DG protein
MTGIDLSYGINNWHNNTTTGPITPIVGRLGSWGWAGSMHPGGAMFCMADGSVHFISETTNTSTLTKLGYMADGSVVNLPW